MEVYVMVVLDGALPDSEERPDSPGKVEVFTELRAAQRSVCDQIYDHVWKLNVERFNHDDKWCLQTRLLAVKYGHQYHIHDQNVLDDLYQKIMEAYNNAPDYLVKENPSFWIHKRTVKEA